MTTYSIPEGPEGPVGPVWDKHGSRWERGYDDMWLRDGAEWTASLWFQLLHRDGPLTDIPPVKVGDEVALNEFSKMPEGSIAGAPREVFIKYMDRVFTDRQLGELDLWEFGDDVVTVLRVGDGEDLT